jgi:hypothetical protein
MGLIWGYGQWQWAMVYASTYTGYNWQKELKLSQTICLVLCAMALCFSALLAMTPPCPLLGPINPLRRPPPAIRPNWPPSAICHCHCHCLAIACSCSPARRSPLLLLSYW